MLVGTMNPEEGELRPQLTDRFGLCIDITSIHNIQQRVEIVELRERFEASPQAFLAEHATAEQELRSRITRAAQMEKQVTVSSDVAELIALINIELDVDGHRGDIVMRRAAQTYAAYLGLEEVTPEHVYAIAPMSLAHRLKRLPLQQSSRTVNDALNTIRKKLSHS
jgi:Mg-chelatase subunit ChlI